MQDLNPTVNYDDYMMRMKIKQGNSRMEPKKSIVLPDEKQSVKLTTNVHGIVLQKAKGNIKDSTVYRYDITITKFFMRRDGTEGSQDLTSQQDEGFNARKVDRNDIRREVYSVLKELPPIVESKDCIYYELHSVLYSLLKLNLGKGNRIDIDVPLLTLRGILPTATKLTATIVQPDKRHIIKLDDFSGVSGDLDRTDNEVLHFLNVLTSQPVFANRAQHIPFSASRTFLMVPQRFGFRLEDTPTFADNHSYVAIGAEKSVRCMEGLPSSKSKKNIALVVETKKTPFHIVEPLSNKVRAMVRDVRRMNSSDISKVNAVIKSLSIFTEHVPGQRKQYMVRQLSVFTARNKQFEVDGQKVTGEDFFRTKYDITLSEPDMPLVVMTDHIGSEIPLELCTVVDNQPLRTRQQTPAQVQQMIRGCAIPPSRHIVENQRTFDSLGLVGHPMLNNAGLVVVPSRVPAIGRVINPPQLIFADNGVAQVRTNDFTWNNPGQYLVPGCCNRWAAFALLGNRDSILPRDFDAFLDRFTREAQRRGVRIPSQPYNLTSPQRTLPTTRANVENAIVQAKTDGCDYVLVIHSDKDDQTHAFIKLFEHTYEIQTQALRLATVRNVVQKGQPATVENIVNKANLKLRGINYSLAINSESAKEIIDQSMLIIGIATNHLSGGRGGKRKNDASIKTDVKVDAGALPQGPPSILGYSANTGSHPFEFVGDFILQPDIGEADMSKLATVISQCVEAYKHERKCAPRQVLVYYGQCSEGSFRSVLRLAVPIIRYALQSSGCQDAKLTFIVPNRLQSIRLFNQTIDRNARATAQNIVPGVVVDHTVVHPEFCEFFLNSHRALQGTARTPKYTVLLDENNFTMAKLEDMTYLLCYGHQIVYMPTSLPTPLYVADMYAQRGRKLVNASPNNIDDYERGTEQLGYHSKGNFKRYRLNA